MKSIKQQTTGIALLSIGLVFFSACNSEPKHEDPKDQAEEVNEMKFNKEGEKDADRISEAYCGNLFEIKASESAATRATTADVKKLASMMSMQHTKMNTDLQTMAASKNITLPADITDDQRKKLSDIEEKGGLAYDKEYTNMLKDKHEDAEKLYKRISEKTEDADIKAWADKTLPEVQAHLDMVKATKNKLDEMKEEDYKNSNKNDWNKKSDLHDGKDDIHQSNKK